MIDSIKTDIRNLNPGYFALAMATAIVSLAAHFEEMPRLAWALFVLNNLLYGILWLLYATRLCLFRDAVLADLTGHDTSPSFLTAVAGTCVLGIQHVLIGGNEEVAAVLWFLGIGLWLILIYTFFASITVAEPKPGIGTGLSGVWLLATVSTQSISVLGTLLAPTFPTGRDVALFVALSAFLLGCMFYLLIITLILYRLSFYRLPPETLTPPYWINMGAVAITTLAGARLTLEASSWPFLHDLRPFLTGFTLFFWVAATWWIPLLVILGVWRHVVRGVALRYHPQYWSIVFPLGMYTVSTFQLARAIELPALSLIPRYFVYVALAAWLVTFVAMVANLVLRFVGRTPTRP